jgi:hypothetical protein
LAERIIDIAAPKIMVTIMIAKANAGQVHAHQGACDTFDIPALFPLGYMCRRVRDFYWRSLLSARDERDGTR